MSGTKDTFWPPALNVDTWRVRLQHYHPVGRFGASFYVKTNERYALEAQAQSRSTQIDEM